MRRRQPGHRGLGGLMVQEEILGRSPMSAGVSRDTVHSIMRATLDYSRSRDYAGYNKHDGLNSPLLHALLGHHRLTRLVGVQLVMRAPINVRPLLAVPRAHNPKGLGLFAAAMLDLYAAEHKGADLDEARRLLAWLLDHPATGFRGLSWGYPYPWQDVGFFAPRHFPNRVTTCWVAFAFVEAYRLTGAREYEEAVLRIADFLTGEPNVLYDDASMKCYSYVPDASVTWAVMDVPALVGAYLAEAGQLLGRRAYLDEARRLLTWVADKQTEYGAWFYTHPSTDSSITHDNYHTAIILDCLDRYRVAANDERFDEAWRAGLRYYRDHLFAASGAPRWMSDREYPYDIHGAASAILCFTRAAARDPAYGNMATSVLDWTVENLYDPRGFFYYQRTRWFTKRFCLMRWANAWMCRALASVYRSSGARHE